MKPKSIQHLTTLVHPAAQEKISEDFGLARLFWCTGMNQLSNQLCRIIMPLACFTARIEPSIWVCYFYIISPIRPLITKPRVTTAVVLFPAIRTLLIPPSNCPVAPLICTGQALLATCAQAGSCGRETTKSFTPLGCQLGTNK